MSIKGIRNVPGIIPLSMIEVVNALGLSLLIPLLPGMVAMFGGHPLWYGILLSTYACGQFVCAPIWGSLSDRYGRKKILLLTQRGTLMSWIILGIAWFVGGDWNVFGVSLPLIVIACARVCDGITAGNNAVINAYVTDVSPTIPGKIKLFGVMAAMLGIGVMIGPLLGSISASFSSRGIFGTIIFAAVLSLVTFVMTALMLPESLPEDQRHRHALSIRKHLKIFDDMISVGKNHYRIALLRIVLGLFFLFFIGFVTVFILYLKDYYGFDTLQVGLMTSLVAGIFLLHQFVVLPRISKIFSPNQILLMGHLLMIVGLGGIFGTLILPWMIICSIIIASGIAWSFPILNALIAEYSPIGQEGRIMGLKESIVAIASVVGPLLSVAAYELFDSRVFILYVITGVLSIMIIYYQLNYNQQTD